MEIRFYDVGKKEYVDGDDLIVNKDCVVQELEYIDYQSTGGDYNLLDVNGVEPHFYKDGERIV